MSELHLIEIDLDLVFEQAIKEITLSALFPQRSIETLMFGRRYSD